MTAGFGPVRVEHDGDVAVVVLDNPPVNASTARIRSGLLEALRQTANDDAVTGVVLIGAGKHLMSGSDLREFSADDVPEPQLPEVLSAIENHPRPVVAAMSGSTLGGGLELALACDRRIAHTGSRVGLPEVSLGMIPGAGGIVRSARLLEPDQLLDLVVSAEPIPVESAAELGLVDDVVDDLREAAVAAARTTTKRVLTSLPTREGAPGLLEDRARRLIAGRGADPAVVAAVGAVLTATALPAPTALRHERAEFTRLRRGPQAAARRHVFFARVAAAREARPGVERPVRTVGVIGAGTMGAGIARAFASAGVDVALVDRDTAALERATDHVARAGGDAVARLRTGTAFDLISDVDLVVEAVVEDLDVKIAVLGEAAGVVRPGVPLATNTSYLDIDALAAAVADPERVLGMHFLAPAHRTRVLEVVRGSATSREALEHVLSAARALGKLPVIVGVCDGFAGNRIFSAYRHQCELLVEEGATPRQVDDALVDVGFAMGPFAVADMSGLDVAWHARRRRDASRDPRERYSDLADRFVEKGRLGQKTGAGWYRYLDGDRTPLDDPESAGLIDDARAANGITPREIRGVEIVERVLTATANEAALVLAEGVAARPGDIDVLMTWGYGFPESLGGPCHWASTRSAADHAAALERLKNAVGWGFQPGDPVLLG
ncbi:3-hydroxyacyl-CoA dehydrogenase NAD-binding domain-containing protein [Saccharopolyspora sp. TS4A08]|uniref:3-hydroxyacyl-CoA dehydrogenase NAD-binding domain-containing protein n=1 Tax=Saccharopolyspora ipomoeae TaxID=3042027 RepID=A0ABT6PSF7_9PSEU|nr:3-hydroxyacyl-CoA dehydrogenase NAD-binding domain-containing protein [Saccharopolyspora sp. TS4A08]MDI2030578.1 3-hydroxyacyl-CoA dehydrogenase NAD-binding domain-containing protein [Saccharopolyspora sp. TS4A08]